MRPTHTIESLLKRTVVVPDGCWIFQGVVHGTTGHCKVSYRGKDIFIHRLSAHLHWGFDLNSSKLILHKAWCPYPNCWNPEHLYEGTHADNTKDSILSGTFHFTKVTTHCPQGHEFTEENTGINSNSGKKYCKECNRLRAAKYRELRT